MTSMLYVLVAIDSGRLMDSDVYTVIPSVLLVYLIFLSVAAGAPTGLEPPAPTRP